MFELKTQILYVPQHAEGQTGHPDCEKGFVMNYTEDTDYRFCRFFHKYPNFGLRTVSCSERVHVRFLVAKNSYQQSEIDELYKHIKLGKEGKLLEFWENKK